MSDPDSLRQDLTAMVDELRATLREIGDGPIPQAQVMTDARDRLRYISSLTEQAASQTLNAAETIGDRLREQRAEAEALLRLTRSPRLRAFLARLADENGDSAAMLSEVIQAQAFQDLVGQVVNKLLVTVQRMEDSLAHLLIEASPEGALAGPQISQDKQVSQDDIDALFG